MIKCFVQTYVYQRQYVENAKRDYTVQYCNMQLDMKEKNYVPVCYENILSLWTYL